MAKKPTHKDIDDVIKMKHSPKYERVGECNRCGACCSFEDPPCEYFVPATETQLAECTIWGDPDRDIICSRWPEQPPVTLESCGYRFINLWTGEELGLRES